MSKRKRNGNGDDEIDFPAIKEKRPMSWFEFFLGMFGAYVVGIFSIETCENKAWVIAKITGCIAFLWKAIVTTAVALAAHFGWR